MTLLSISQRINGALISLPLHYWRFVLFFIRTHKKHPSNLQLVVQNNENSLIQLLNASFTLLNQIEMLEQKNVNEIQIKIISKNHHEKYSSIVFNRYRRMFH